MIFLIRFYESIIEYFKRTDFILWLLSGSTIIYSLLLIFSMQRSGTYNFMGTQTLAVIIGSVMAVIISLADYRVLLKKWYFAAAISVLLLLSVFLFGIQVEGTDDTAWLNIAGLSVQPSEFVKILFIITFSSHLHYLHEKNLIASFSGVVTLVLHAAVPMAVIHIQGDDGTVLIFAFIFLVMTFTAGVQKRYFAILAGSLLVGIPLIWTFFLNNEHRNRFLALFDIDGNAMTNYGWQQYQGKISIASGGLFGEGYQNGTRVEYGIVPEQENDFILTVAGEEFGFIGCILILLLLSAIALKILFNGEKSNDLRGKYICSGVFGLIASQTIINIGMVLGFLPVVGITLPFFSAGGTSVMSLLICIGLVQSVICHNIDDMNTVSIRRETIRRTRM